MTSADSDFSPSAARSFAGRLFVISAPSGAGKTTITNRLRQTESLQVSISYTTRAPRDGEADGREYFFVGREEFFRIRDGGGFLEWAEVFGNYYGTSAEWVNKQSAAGENVLLEIDVQGARQIKGKMPESVLIFIRPPSAAALESRLRGRGNDSPAAVARRLAAAEAEMAHSAEFDHIVINDDLERAVGEIRAILRTTQVCTKT